MQPSYVHFASVPKTFIDKRREQLFNLLVFGSYISPSPMYLIDENKDPLQIGQDRILLRPYDPQP